MTTVQNPDLGFFVWVDICDELRSGGIEIGPGPAESVCDHPLHEALAMNREVVGDPESLLDLSRVPRLRAGRDPVHHRAGERNVVGDPGCQPRIPGRGQVRPEIALQHGAVVAQVVAAQDGQGRPAGGAALAERGPEIGVHRALPGAALVFG